LKKLGSDIVDKLNQKLMDESFDAIPMLPTSRDGAGYACILRTGAENISIRSFVTQSQQAMNKLD